jgi:hypothetical protein
VVGKNTIALALYWISKDRILSRYCCLPKSLSYALSTVQNFSHAIKTCLFNGVLPTTLLVKPLMIDKIHMISSFIRNYPGEGGGDNRLEAIEG